VDVCACFSSLSFGGVNPSQGEVMSLTATLPNHLRPRREKCFGDGRPQPLDREGKLRIMFRARALMHRTEKGKAYGAITAKALAVLEALLWGFHNSRSGVCIPGYDTIAKRAGCARSTVAEAIKALEDAGLLSWVHRLVRIREAGPDLFGIWANHWRVIRTSNSYFFRDWGRSKVPDLPMNSSKSDFPSGTPIQDLSSKKRMVCLDDIDPDLLIALGNLGNKVKKSERA
jgi:Helix-turn-helix domain